MKVFRLAVLFLCSISIPLFASVTVTNPASGAKVTSPVHYAATGSSSCAGGVTSMEIYVSGTLTYKVAGKSLDTDLTLKPGSYNTTVKGLDKCGASTSKAVDITVVAALAPNGVVITSPAANAVVASPVTFTASSSSSSCSKGISSIGIYLDSVEKYKVKGATLNTQLAASNGVHHATIKAWTNCSSTISSVVTFTVQPAAVAPTVNISANPTSIVAGASSSLSVSASNATQLVVAGSDGTSYTLAATGGSVSVKPTNTTTYTATATGSSAKATAAATVSVTAPAATVTLTASPTSIAVGGSSLLTLVATNASGVTLTGSDGSSYPVSATGGSQSVSPSATTTYTARATSGSGSTASAMATVTVAAPTLSITAASSSLSQGSTLQLTATASFADGTSSNVTSSTQWSVTNSAVASISSSGLLSGVNVGATSLSGTYDGVNATYAFAVTVAQGTGVNIPTFHVDTNRSGLNAAELSLSPANVTSQTFGKLFSYLTDGYVYGEPLLMSNVTVNGAQHNVLYAATENDSVYAFDADSYGSGSPLWQVSLLLPGETPKTNAQIGPVQGVTSTPVIDPSTNTIYVVSQQTNGSTASYRLNALDIKTGAHKFGSPISITASVPGTAPSSNNGIVSLPKGCVQRAALLLANNNIYIGFGNCAMGWLLAYDAQALTQTAVFNASPNIPGEGAYGSAGGIWMGAGGPAADAAGNVYAVTGNGPWDGQTAFGDTVLRFNSTLALQDYFTPSVYQYMNCSDADLGSGGTMLIPGANEIIAGGKMGLFYLLNTTNLGQEQPNDAGALQEIYFEPDLSAPFAKNCSDSAGTHTAYTSAYEFFGTPAYFNGSLYAGVTPTSSGAPGVVRQFRFSGQIAAGNYTSQTAQENTRAATPFVSANGTQNGIVWVLDQGLPLQNSSGTTTAATLRAFDATDLSNSLYNSSTNSSDVPGYGIKFTSPIVANGKVYISTGHDLTTVSNPQGEIDVYGLN